jgi:beta-aspartyl-peptidase (threonine type)
MRTVAAYDVAARMAYQKLGIEAAGRAAIDSVGGLGGDGGLIAVDCTGRLTMPFNSGGMKRGFVTLDGSPVVEVY